MKELFVLFDGNNLFYRCFFAVKGNRQQAFRLFHDYLSKIKKKFKNTETHFIFFWDSPKNWRKKHLDSYKENRKKRTDDKKAFFEQLFFSMDLLKRKLEYKNYLIENYEADDVISLFIRTIADSVDKHYFLIVSNDKDYHQLLADNANRAVAQLMIKKKGWEYLTYKKFCNEKGIKPEEFTGVLALMGDESDNITGIPGIGIKRALKVVKEYGDVKNWIFDNWDDAEGLKLKCLEHADTVKKNLMLVDLHINPIFFNEKIEWEKESEYGTL